MEKGYEFRAYPNRRQRELIHKTFGCKRFVYNHFLAEKKELWLLERKNLGYSEMSRLLTRLKQEKPFLCEPDKCALQNAIHDLV